ncbi:MAG: hypothetical protein R3336_08925, partial [Phycisphaeraceae bacterium]|nr:hypothetical protein [Phycisphaeraceae bacterium]
GLPTRPMRSAPWTVSAKVFPAISGGADQHGIGLAATKGDAQVVHANRDGIAPEGGLMQDLDPRALDETEFQQHLLEFRIAGTHGRHPAAGTDPARSELEQAGVPGGCIERLAAFDGQGKRSVIHLNTSAGPDDEKIVSENHSHPIDPDQVRNGSSVRSFGVW